MPLRVLLNTTEAAIYQKLMAREQHAIGEILKLSAESAICPLDRSLLSAKSKIAFLRAERIASLAQTST